MSYTTFILPNRRQHMVIGSEYINNAVIGILRHLYIYQIEEFEPENINVDPQTSIRHLFDPRNGLARMKYTASNCLLCAVNVISDAKEIAEDNDEKIDEDDCNMALAILLSDFNMLFDDDERDQVIDDFDSDGYQLQYDQKNQHWIPLRDDGVSMMTVIPLQSM